jgi:hypothetical protein
MPEISDLLLDELTRRILAMPDLGPRLWTEGLAAACRYVQEEDPGLKRTLKKGPAGLEKALLKRWGELALEDPRLWPFSVGGSRGEETGSAGEWLFKRRGVIPRNPLTLKNCPWKLSAAMAESALAPDPDEKGRAVMALFRENGKACWPVVPAASSPSVGYCGTVLSLWLGAADTIPGSAARIPLDWKDPDLLARSVSSPASDLAGEGDTLAAWVHAHGFADEALLLSDPGRLLCAGNDPSGTLLARILWNRNAEGDPARKPWKVRMDGTPLDADGKPLRLRLNRDFLARLARPSILLAPVRTPAYRDIRVLDYVIAAATLILRQALHPEDAAVLAAALLDCGLPERTRFRPLQESPSHARFEERLLPMEFLPGHLMACSHLWRLNPLELDHWNKSHDSAAEFGSALGRTPLWPKVKPTLKSAATAAGSKEWYERCAETGDHAWRCRSLASPAGLDGPEPVL